MEAEPFVDIHCHLLPGIDDGAKDLDESLAMARMAVADGISTIIVTPHQLGAYRINDGPTIRRRIDELAERLRAERVPLRVLPGADVRIEPDLISLVERGEVLTLADRGRHVLLELPHELYMPLDPLLSQLSAARLTGILSHPERNQGLLDDPRPIARLVESGCLMQVTAGSLLGTFGPASQKLSQSLLAQGLVHFISTDAHGARSRRPLLHSAFERVAEWTDWQTACDLCCRNPALVAEGRAVPAGVRRPGSRARRSRWPWSRVA